MAVQDNLHLQDFVESNHFKYLQLTTGLSMVIDGSSSHRSSVTINRPQKRLSLSLSLSFSLSSCSCLFVLVVLLPFFRCYCCCCCWQSCFAGCCSILLYIPYAIINTIECKEAWNLYGLNSTKIDGPNKKLLLLFLLFLLLLLLLYSIGLLEEICVKQLNL